MQFHVVIEGEKRGPYPIFRVIELLRAGEVSPDALGWEQGMESWKPLRGIPAFAETVQSLETPPDPADKEDFTGDLSPGPEAALAGPVAEGASRTREFRPAGEARPFIRFWARTFDYMLVSLLVVVFVDVPTPPFSPDEPIDIDKLKEFFTNPAYQELAKLQYIALFVWHALEGLLVCRFGATPGKALFGISIAGQDGRRLPLSRGMSRAFLVWATGFGLGLFPFNLIGMGLGLFMLLTGGATFWDRQLAVEVRHTRLGPGRILMAAGGFLLLMILSSLKFS